MAYAQDVVTTTSGDRLVGEIKRAEKDVLPLETAYSDADFKIEWEDVAALESNEDYTDPALPNKDGRSNAIRFQV